jgi:hypothetical protein
MTGRGDLIAATLVQEPRYVDCADGRWDENAAFIAMEAPEDAAERLGVPAVVTSCGV